MSDALAGFDWDEGNRKKCQKHGVTLDEIEAALSGPMRVFPDPAHSAVETPPRPHRFHVSDSR
jgi:uncharacterized DUF497 family protein